MSTVKVQDVDVILIDPNNTGQLNVTTTPAMKNHHSATTKNSLSVFSHFKFEHLLAGVSGGAISTLILHPLDLMKIRFAGKKTDKNTNPNFSCFFCS